MEIYFNELQKKLYEELGIKGSNFYVNYNEKGVGNIEVPKEFEENEIIEIIRNFYENKGYSPKIGSAISIEKQGEERLIILLPLENSRLVLICKKETN